MCKEVWKDIRGYEWIYQISNLGNVKSLERKSYNGKGEYIQKERILKYGIRKGGYKAVFLYKDAKGKNFFIHRLVADAFLENPLNKEYVDHINTNTGDNRVENLRWVSPKENINNENTLKKKSEKIGKKIICVTTGEEFESIIEASNKYNVIEGSIRNCLKGRQRTAGKSFNGEKLTWKYYDEYLKEIG